MRRKLARWLGRLRVLGLVVLFSAPNLASAYYDPGVQRWLNRDPVQEHGGSNLYTFARNHPNNGIDPLGLSLGDGPSGGGIGGPLLLACRRAKDELCNRTVGANVLLQLENAGIDGNADETGGNAFRHCLAACQSSKACGSDSAKRFWDGRERHPDGSVDEQDYSNNHVGYANAAKSSCWDACMASWNGGSLTCSSGGQYHNCPPYVIPPIIPVSAAGPP